MAKLPVPSAPILVVGDIMCDHYVWGDVERISPEAPVQVLRWEREADRPGGAANAATNPAWTIPVFVAEMPFMTGKRGDRHMAPVTFAVAGAISVAIS